MTTIKLEGGFGAWVANRLFPWWRGRSQKNKAWLLLVPMVDIVVHMTLGIMQMLFLKKENNYLDYFMHSFENSRVFQVKFGFAVVCMVFAVYILSSDDAYKWRRRTLTDEHDIMPKAPLSGAVVGILLFLIFGPMDISPYVLSGVNLLWLAITQGPMQ